MWWRGTACRPIKHINQLVLELSGNWSNGWFAPPFFLVMCLSSISTAKGIALIGDLCGIAAQDKFKGADYTLSYVLSSMQTEAPTEEIQFKAAKYAKKRQNVASNTIPLYLAQYYF